MLIVSVFITLLTAAFELFNGHRGVVIIPYAMIVPLVLITPRALHARVFSAVTTQRWLRRMETIQLLILMLNAPASLWFHSWGFQYDRFLHFWVGVLCVPWAYLLFGALRRRWFPRYEFRFARFALVVSIIGIVGVFAWELYQHTVDMLFGTRLFYDSKQPIEVDFWEDVIFGLMGMLGGLYLVRTVLVNWEESCFIQTSAKT